MDWQSGFSVITGETGAGKSIILGALNLLLGSRADAKVIQAGQSKCVIEATFSLDGIGLKSFFEQNDIDFDPEECIIRREVMQTGKSRAFINDTPVSAAKLREVGVSLIDIHSQHQNLLIRNEHFLIDTLDTIAANSALFVRYRQAHHDYKRSVELLDNLHAKAEEGRKEQEFLLFNLNQITDAQLRPDEENELEGEQKMLAHAEEIKEAFFSARSLIDSDEMSMPQRIRMAVEKLRSVERNYAESTDLISRLDSVRIELSDIEDEINRHAESVDYDPGRLAFVEERLNVIYALEQKHHVGSVEDLLSIARTYSGQLAEIENIDDTIAEQQRKVDELETLRNTLAQDLTDTRLKAAEFVDKELAASLQHLGMPNVRVEMRLTRRGEPDESGADNIRFLFSANKNVAPQDISQIASGGEIARLMLSLKAIIARRKSLPTIIFDEIDTGVSGNMAERMAQVMMQISASCQVICITHLPQIAALGTYHFKVYKEETAEATVSHIVALSSGERVAEIAHMLSGSEISAAAIDNAKVLLKHKDALSD